MTGLGGPGGPDTGGGLVVSGGGTTMVATDALLAQAALVRLLHAEAEGWQARLARIRSLDAAPAPSWTTDDPGLGVFAAERAIDAVEALSRDLADSLVAAAEGYGEAERNAERFARLSGAWLGYTLGRLWPVVLAGAGGALTVAAAAWLLGALTGTGADTPPTDVAAWLHDNPRALTNPAVVAAIRVLVSSVDDTAAGAVGLPLPLSLALGDDGAGLLGVISSAAGALALARPLGLLRETPVTVAQVGGARAQAPPAGLADLAARIPAASKLGPQVRIERYGDAGRRAWVVYIGGTVDWSPNARAEPWDVTSNVSAVADRRSGSFRAVLRAMREAGVRPGDPVIQVGHSQGGLIAAQVAASGAFTTVAVATFGAPSAQVPVVAGVPTLSVEHADDLVPALAGSPPGVDARLVVRREVYAGAAVPANQALPAHSLANYRDTARLIDASPEPRLLGFRARLESVVGTLPGESTSWRATRIPPPPAPVPAPAPQPSPQPPSRE